MWGLYGWLLSKGQVAYTNATSENPNDFIAIYPEIYQGNEANAGTVVRYLLNKPGAMALYGTPGPTTFDKSDIIYSFSKMYYDTNEKHTLFLPILDLHLFKDQGRKRTKRVVFVGKGKDEGLHPKECIAIDRKFATDQQALAGLLNECDVLYSYDPVSAMTEIARLCGCRVVMLQKTYTKSEYRNYEPGLNGMSFGLDEEVPLDSKGFRAHYYYLRKTFSERLDELIEETQCS
jgi:hypothetical protein